METSPKPGRAVRFAIFELDLAVGELRKNGLKGRLQDQPFQLLAALVELGPFAPNPAESPALLPGSSMTPLHLHGLPVP